MAITETEKRNLADALSKASRYPSEEAAGHVDRFIDGLDLVFAKDGEVGEIPDGSIEETKFEPNLQIKIGTIGVTLEDFGGEVNTESVDNTPALVAAMNSLSNGGTIQLRPGLYNFDTPLNRNTPLLSTKIQGAGMMEYAKNHGTGFNYNGSGYFLNFNDGFQYSELSEFSIFCNGANGLKLQQGSKTVNDSKLEKFKVFGSTEGIDVRDFAYMSLIDCSVTPSLNYSDPNTNAVFGIRAGAGNGVREFLFLKRTNSDAGAGPAANDTGITGTAVIIQDCNNVYVEDCDFSNWGSGKSVQLITTGNGAMFMIFFDGVNLTRCDGGIDIYAQSDYITQATFNNITGVHRGSSVGERIIKIRRESFYGLVGGHFNNIYARKLLGTAPTYDLESSVGGMPLLNYQSFSGAGAPLGFNILKLDSPTFTGSPIVPNMAKQTYTLQAASARYVEDAVSFGQASATDANYTITQARQTIKLPIITANRNLSFPAANFNTGRKITLINRNNTGFNWVYPASVLNAMGVDAGNVENEKVTVLESDGTNWLIMSVY